MGERLIVPPNREPVELVEMKQHLRVELDDTHEDALIKGLIAAAREFAESETRRAFITQTWERTLCEFPLEIKVSRSPLQSVVSVKYYDLGGVLQTLDPSVYLVSNYTEPGIIYPDLGYRLPGYRWPYAYPRPDSIIVQFIAGYGEKPEDVPETIRQAIKLHVAHLFENREPVNIGNIVTPIDLSYKALIDRNRVWCPA